MRAVSKKQAQRNREVARIKESLPERCFFCGCYLSDGDAAHLLPKSIYPQYYTEPLNIVRACRTCHMVYDDSVWYRSQCEEAIEQAGKFATIHEIRRHFGL